MTRRILVTAALPYANYSIHLGHMVEHIQTDIWVRFQKLRGNDCIFCCADDTHGTPIMIRARQEGIKPEQLIARTHEDHVRDFAGFDIGFDNYYTTHSDENRKLSELIYQRLKDAGHIETRDVEQAYCEKCGMFLPDRFIRGTCPKCSAPDQYGDNCEACNATYTPLELKDAFCSTCRTAPVRKSARHYFFKLGDFAEPLKKWMAAGRVSEQIQNKLQEWFDQGLRDWDISRDAPYFGFLIPGETDKYFYVWLDAPIGYMASTMNYCARAGRNFEEYWCDPATEIHHFIGKDITYFHALFWPAMLMGSGFNTPTKLTIHGFLTVKGEKMSKSRGTFITAATYLKHLDPQYLRYYYACKLAGGVEDIDLNLDDFVQRVNSDLVGNIANLASRSISMLSKNLQGRLGVLSNEGRELLGLVRRDGDAMAQDYETRNYAQAMRRLCALADEVNRYIDARKPWTAVKTDAEHARETLTTVINAVRLLSIYLKPVLPALVAKIENMLKVEPLRWSDLDAVLEQRTIGEFERLIERIDPARINDMIESNKNELANHKATTSQPAGAAATSGSAPAVGSAADATAGATSLPADSPLVLEPLAPQITFDDFVKVDLRVAKVLKAEVIEGADKLLRLEVDLGGQTRHVIAGIRKAYDPATLIGRLIIIAANLAPRKMKFGTSEGMILAAGAGGPEVFVLSVDSGAKPGYRIH